MTFSFSLRLAFVLVGLVLYALPIGSKPNEVGRLALLAGLIAMAIHGGV